MNRIFRLARPLVIVALLTMTFAQVVTATHLINWNYSPFALGQPDKGNFGWYNVDASWLRWHGRIHWSSANGRHGGLIQAMQYSYNPILEYEGYNPGLQTDCDNLNFAGINSSLPRLGYSGVDGDCPGDNPSIIDQVDIRIDGFNVAPDTTYAQYALFSKTYLNDYNPSWREVNFSYEEQGGAPLRATISIWAS